MTQASFSLQVRGEILAWDAPVSTGAHWYQVLLHQLKSFRVDKADQLSHSEQIKQRLIS